MMKKAHVLRVQFPVEHNLVASVFSENERGYILILVPNSQNPTDQPCSGGSPNFPNIPHFGIFFGV